MANSKKVTTTAEALTAVPDGLRLPLIEAYNSVVKNFAERRWEPAELNGGKFCEIVYSILRGCIDGKYAAKPEKPKNMLKACLDIENCDPAK